MVRFRDEGSDAWRDIARTKRRDGNQPQKMILKKKIHRYTNAHHI